MLDLSNFVIRGRIWKFGDSVDTNIIAPLHVMRKGEIEEIAQHTMAAVRPEFPAQVRPGDIIVAGANFGCGSHREEANRVLEKVGIRAIVAESVARIFLRNSINLAYPTLVAPGVSSLRGGVLRPTGAPCGRFWKRSRFTPARMSSTSRWP